MVGPLPAGPKWTSGDEKQLIELLASGVKAPAIARQTVDRRRLRPDQ